MLLVCLFGTYVVWEVTRGQDEQRLAEQFRTRAGRISQDITTHKQAEMERARQECADRPDRGEDGSGEVERRAARLDLQRPAEDHGADHHEDRRHDAADQERPRVLPVVARHLVPEHPAQGLLDGRSHWCGLR